MRWREEEIKGWEQNFTHQYPAGSVEKNPPSNAGNTRDMGREDASGEGNGNLLQYSCQEYPMDRGAWSVFHGITKSWP